MAGNDLITHLPAKMLSGTPGPGHKLLLIFKMYLLPNETFSFPSPNIPSVVQSKMLTDKFHCLK